MQKHRGGGKGDVKPQWTRANAKRRLKRLAAAAAAGRHYRLGRPQGPQKKRVKGAHRVRAQALIRRRLRGKQAPVGMHRFARTIPEASQAAKQAKPNAVDQEALAGSH